MSENLDTPISSGEATTQESAATLLRSARVLMTTTEYAAVRKQVESGELRPWLAVFLYFIKFIDEDDCFLEFSIKGMKTFLSMASRWEKQASETARRREIEIMIAKREKGSGFSAIYNRHTVTLWNMLDATLFESLVHLFLSNPKAREIEGFQKIKISLRDYDVFSRTQVTRMAVAELKRELGTGRLSKGIRTYEQIYKSLGIEPTISDALDKSLIELRALRNAIVHNMGILDERAANDCGWLSLTPGTPVVVKADQYETYKMAALQYVGTAMGKTMTAKASTSNKP